MSRISPVDRNSATPEQIAVFDVVEKAMGGVPNLLSTMAHSPAAAKGYLALNQTLSGGLLKPVVREQLALAIGQENTCDYCVSAHSMLGARAGLSDNEIRSARNGVHNDPKTSAILEFALRVVRGRGIVSDTDFESARNAGITDGELVEVAAHVALNVFTNYFNHIAGTEIDFPVAPALS